MLRKFFVATSITVFAIGGSTACATKKFVRSSVGEVNEKVDSQGRAIEETQERTRRNEGRISEVDQKAAAAATALGHPVRTLSVPRAALYASGAVGTLLARLTRRPSVLGLAKMREFLHPDWVAAGSPPAGFKPLWDIEKGFADAVKWYASRGLLKSNGEVDLSP